MRVGRWKLAGLERSGGIRRWRTAGLERVQRWSGRFVRVGRWRLERIQRWSGRFVSIGRWSERWRNLFWGNV